VSAELTQLLLDAFAAAVYVRDAIHAALAPFLKMLLDLLKGFS